MIGLAMALGFVIGIFLMSIAWKSEIKFKADSGIDLKIGRRYYTITRNIEREINQ